MTNFLMRDYPSIGRLRGGAGRVATVTEGTPTMNQRKTYLRTLLLKRSAWMEDRVIQKAQANGYSAVTPAMSRLFGHMGGQPIGLSDLARRMEVSRQAVHKLANEAARLGLVEFVVSPDDGRVVRLQFTQAGWAMSATALRDFDDLEQRLKVQMGARNLNELKRLLALPWDEQEQVGDGSGPADGPPASREHAS